MRFYFHFIYIKIAMHNLFINTTGRNTQVGAYSFNVYFANKSETASNI